MVKRVLLLVAIFLTLLSVGAAGVYAQPDPDGGPEDDQETVGGDLEYTGDRALIEQYTEATRRCDSPSLECLVYYTVNYTAIEITNSIAPVNPDNGGSDNSGDDNGPGGDASTGPTIAGRQGILPGMAYLIGQMYANPAANTHTYVADVLDSAGVGIAQPAYAQGLGFVALNPILELWKTFRNIAYIFYVLIFVVIGFLIMFRQKVGQQAITAQQAIPSIIVSLIFVTFSYAIAGFLIDLMYLSMFLIIGIFQGVGTVSSDIISFNIFELGGEFLSGGTEAGFNVASNAVSNMINAALSLQEGSAIGEVFGWVGGITVGLVVAIAVLIATFKLFFELLKSYATIVLLVVTGPIQLMMGAIPGRNVASNWIKNLVANLSVFPVVLLAIVMFEIFTEGAISSEGGGFMPPFLIGRGLPNAIASIMGLAILLAIPEIVKKVKEMFGATGGFGEAIAGAAWDRAKAGGAKGIGKTATGLVGAGAMGGIGAVGGGVIGGIQARRRGEGFRTGFGQGARRGAAYGGIAGGAFGSGMDLIRKPYRLINQGMEPLRNINEAYEGYQSLTETGDIRAVIEQLAQRRRDVSARADQRTTTGQPRQDEDGIATTEEKRGD